MQHEMEKNLSEPSLLREAEVRLFGASMRGLMSQKYTWWLQRSAIQEMNLLKTLQRSRGTYSQPTALVMLEALNFEKGCFISQ